MPVTIMDIIDKAVLLNPNFKSSDEKKEFVGYVISLNTEICQCAHALVSVRSRVQQCNLSNNRIVVIL